MTDPLHELTREHDGCARRHRLAGENGRLAVDLLDLMHRGEGTALRSAIDQHRLLQGEHAILFGADVKLRLIHLSCLRVQFASDKRQIKASMSRMASKRLRILRCHAAKARGSLRSKKTSPITSQNSPWWALLMRSSYTRTVKSSARHESTAPKPMNSPSISGRQSSLILRRANLVSSAATSRVNASPPRSAICANSDASSAPECHASAHAGNASVMLAFVTISSRMAARASSSSAQASSSAKVSSSSPYQYIIEATSCAVRGLNTG